MSIEKFKSFLSRCPQPEVIVYLLKFFFELQAHSDTNLMNTEYLSKLFVSAFFDLGVLEYSMASKVFSSLILAAGAFPDLYYTP